MSEIADIYAAIAGLSVSFTSRTGATVSPTVYGLGTIPRDVQTAHLPVRILTPFGQGNNQNQSDIFEPSQIQLVTWQIYDLFLLETMAREEGPHIQAPVLISYASNYVDKISTLARIVSATINTEVNVTGFTISPGVYEYPLTSGVFFYGVQCRVTVTELV